MREARDLGMHSGVVNGLIPCGKRVYLFIFFIFVIFIYFLFGDYFPYNRREEQWLGDMCCG